MIWVKFVKQVRGANADASSEDVMLERVVELPFPPFIGLSVGLDEGEWEDKVTEVHVDLPLPFKGTTIICNTDPVREIEIDLSADDDRIIRPMKTVVKEFTDMGWKVTKE